MKTDRQRAVIATAEIQTAPKNIIKAFTNFEMLNDWWNVDRCIIEKKVGGLYTLVWLNTTNGMQYVSTGIIKKFDGPRILWIENFTYLNATGLILGPMHLKILVTQQNSVSKIKLTQSGYQHGHDWNRYYKAVKLAWPKMIIQLKAYLEHREG